MLGASRDVRPGQTSKRPGPGEGELDTSRPRAPPAGGAEPTPSSLPQSSVRAAPTLARYPGWRSETLPGSWPGPLPTRPFATLLWLVTVQLQWSFCSLQHHAGSHLEASAFATATPRMFSPQIFAWTTPPRRRDLGPKPVLKETFLPEGCLHPQSPPRGPGESAYLESAGESPTR